MLPEYILNTYTTELIALSFALTFLTCCALVRFFKWEPFWATMFCCTFGWIFAWFIIVAPFIVVGVFGSMMTIWFVFKKISKRQS